MSFSSLEILFQIIAFLFAISFHESAHAWSANRLGDPTARFLGRISMNPVRHIDPVGTVLFPLLGASLLVGCVGIGLLVAAKSAERAYQNEEVSPRNRPAP